MYAAFKKNDNRYYPIFKISHKSIHVQRSWCKLIDGQSKMYSNNRVGPFKCVDQIPRQGS